MTTVDDADGAPEDLYIDSVEALSRATVRQRFDPFVDIDWDAPENLVDKDDPRWAQHPLTCRLAATDWYAEQPLQTRIDIGRWIIANTAKVGIQFEMILIRGVMHYAGKLRNSDPVFQYLMHEITDECNHIQMFQEFINRTGEDVPGMRRASRVFAPILGFIGGYVNIVHLIAVLCGEQPIHFQQTLWQRQSRDIPPLLNKISHIHLAEEARHITFADDHLFERVQRAGRCKRLMYAIMFPLFLRWLMGEIFTPPRSFARQFGVPRQTFKSAYWRSEYSQRWLAEAAADSRRVADRLGLRTVWSRWIWRLLSIDGRIPRYRGEPNRPLETSPHTRIVDNRKTLWARLAATSIMATVALVATPDGVRIVAVAVAGTCVWAVYHLLRARRGGMMANQSFEWPRFLIWVAVCVVMIPAGGLIGLALLLFMILSIAELTPTL